MKNIEHEKIMILKDVIDTRNHEVVSRTLCQNDAVSMTLFAFDKGEEISTHASTGDAMVTILEGEAKITIDHTLYELKENDTIIIPANKPHALFAKEAFKMLLTVVFPKVGEE